MKKLLPAFVALFLLGCSARNNSALQPVKAGFKSIRIIDSTRRYQPNAKIGDSLFFRPIDIDIWYPATVSSKDTTLPFRSILGLLEKRANFYSTSSIGNGITGQIAQFFCDRLNCSDSNRVLNFKTQSYHQAKPLPGKYPLIIYLTAYNGMSYENVPLFEELARKGYVVASVSSIGRFPGDMTMKKEDLMEQADDGLATRNYLKNILDLDDSSCALIGYSWGGMATALLTAKLPTVSCVVSLDGSEFHHYSSAREENRDFDDLIFNTVFKDLNIKSPYLRLESSPAARSGKEDSIYDFTKKLSGDWQIYKIDSAQHEDFGCLPQLVRQSGNCTTSERSTIISRLTVGFIEEHLKGTKQFTETVSMELGKTIHRK